MTDCSEERFFFRYLDGKVSLFVMILHHLWIGMLLVRVFFGGSVGPLLGQMLVFLLYVLSRRRCCFLGYQTVALDVDPHTQISEVKTMLIAKHQQTTSCKSHENTAAPITDLSLVTFTFWLYMWWAALGVPATGGVRSDDIFLSSNGKPLVDQAKLSDYHLGSTIHVAGRVRGGCFMLSATVFAIICCACLSSLCTCGLSLVVVPFLLPLLFILPLFCL
jgi:hypothetical protein